MSPLHLPLATTSPWVGVYAALAITWVTAGANFLGFKVAVSALPPFLMMSLRVGVAGLILLLALWVTTAPIPRPSLQQYWDACLSSLLFLVLGQGMIVSGVQYVSAGYAALLAATAPLMTALITWSFGGPRPSRRVLTGILLGLAGLLLLIAPDLGQPGMTKGIVLILVGTIAWGGGMYHAVSMSRPTNILLATALQMLPASAMLFIMSAVSGEFNGFMVSSVPIQAWFALAFLIVAGSLLGYSAFVWMLPRVSAPVANSFFYVGPVIALFLGWIILNETVKPLALIAATITLFGVALMVSSAGDAK